MTFVRNPYLASESSGMRRLWLAPSWPYLRSLPSASSVISFMSLLIDGLSPIAIAGSRKRTLLPHCPSLRSATRGWRLGAALVCTCLLTRAAQACTPMPSDVPVVDAPSPSTPTAASKMPMSRRTGTASTAASSATSAADVWAKSSNIPDATGPSGSSLPTAPPAPRS